MTFFETKSEQKNISSRFLPSHDAISIFQSQIQNDWLRQTASPDTHLQRVLDGVGEVFEGADGDGLFRRVLAGAVGFCEEGDHNLDVAFGSQCAGLQ